MRKYELLLVLPGTLDEGEAAAKSQEIMTMIEENSASAAELKTLGKNRLAYPIKQIRYGYFYNVIFSAESASLQSIRGKLALMPDLLRAMVFHFNSRWSVSQKIFYTTNDLGVTVVRQDKGGGKQAEARPVSTSADLKEIDRKIDEILQSDIIPGV